MKKLLFSLTLLSALAISFGASAKINVTGLKKSYYEMPLSDLRKIAESPADTRMEDDARMKKIAKEILNERDSERPPRTFVTEVPIN